MYVLLSIVSLVLISFFSVGIPEFRFGQRVWPVERNAVLLHNPVPLSFPLYASIRYERDIHVDDMLYRLYLFNFVIQEHWIFFYSFMPYLTFNLSMFDYVLYYSFFMLFNIVGAIIGYWISKTTFIDKLLKKRK